LPRCAGCQASSRNEGFFDLPPDQPFKLLGASRWIEEIQALGRQVSDAWDELEAQEGGDGEDMVGEAASVGILFADFLASVGHQ
jgi:hypothetical protein